MTPESPRRWGTLTRGGAQAVALAMLVLGFLPIANRIPGGPAAPWYRNIASGWVSGSAIVLGGGLVLAILSRRMTPLWREGRLQSLIARYAAAPLGASLLIALVALAAYLAVAVLVLDVRPLFIDEIVQVFQARILAGGTLWKPAPPHPEFFSSMHIIDNGGRVYGQFPVGGPAMLALGTLVGAEWAVGPICGALAVLAFAVFVRRAEPRAGVALGATLLFAFAPFTMFMSGTHMNHVTSLMWILAASAGTVAALESAAPRPVLAFGSGLAFGCAATIRPVDAFAFALPAGLWYLSRAVRSPPRWRDALSAGLGVALPLGGLLYFNAHTTGDPLLFGYAVMWGHSHDLGFHAAPWGDVHTPSRGLELLNVYFLQLQSYLFETPIPSLLPAILALTLGRRLNPPDRYLLGAVVLVAGFYFAYWHEGFYLGPRFIYPLVPFLALWTARLPSLVRERFGAGLPYRATVHGYVIAAGVAGLALIPLRVREYKHALVTPRWNADRAAAAAGVRDALVLVRESWGAELLARMWALGVSRSEGELLYYKIDSCVLEQRLTELEAGGAQGEAALSGLRPLLRDSARVERSPFSTDDSERYLPGIRYPEACVRQVREEATGFTLFPPLLLARGGNNIYARDLDARDSLLLKLYPDRPVYLLRPQGIRFGQMPEFHRLPVDSLWHAWRGERAAPPGPGR
ncbi:MAG: hypothetical protein ACREMO_07045 [Gemmatimonadales bacterium]